MPGRQEQEQEWDKASMCEWGIWCESRKLVSSGHTRMCSTERGDGSRRQSEKVGMRKAGMPNPESSDGNFMAAGG